MAYCNTFKRKIKLPCFIAANHSCKSECQLKEDICLIIESLPGILDYSLFFDLS